MPPNYYSDSAYEIPGHWISEVNILALSLAVRLASTIPDPALKNDLCASPTTRRTGYGCTTSTRAIQPLHLLHYMGSWHLISWCNKHRKVRDFVLPRIRKVAPAGEPRSHPCAGWHHGVPKVALNGESTSGGA